MKEVRSFAPAIVGTSKFSKSDSQEITQVSQVDREQLRPSFSKFDLESKLQ